jgi:MFS family permease
LNETRLPRVLRSLDHRNFRLFFAGQLISLTGTWMQSIAQAWLVYRLTDSALLLGLTGFLGQIPVFLFAPFGGALADKGNRRRILICTQAASMLLASVLAWLSLSGQIQVSHILLLAALLGMVNAIDIPTRQSFIVDLVGREDLMNAIALNSSMFNAARIVGPAVAGLTVATVGEGWCFFANAVSYVAVIASLALIRTPQKTQAPLPGSVFASIVEGFSFVRRTKPVRALLALLGLVSIVGMPYAVLMPIFADRILQGGASGLGLLMGASGIGALIGALMLAARQGLRGLGGWVAFSCAGFGIGLILFSFSRWFWLSAALLVPIGFFMMVQMASSNTLIQSMVPDRLRGRVMAVYSMMFMGMAPFGALLAGALADGLGAPAALALGGALCVAAAIHFGRRLPALREEGREIIVALQAAAGTPDEQVTGEASVVAVKGK